MKIQEIGFDDKIDFGAMKIASIEENQNTIQIIYHVDNEYPNENFLKIISTKGQKILVYSNQVLIELIEVINVQCDDWFTDEKIPKSSINQPLLRWNDEEQVAEYNVLRTIYNDFPEDYINYIDISFDSILSISKSSNDDILTFELVLKAPYNQTSLNDELVLFYSGPIKFQCKQINIIID